MQPFADESEKLFGTTECVRVLKAELANDSTNDAETSAILELLRNTFPKILGGQIRKRAVVGPASKAFVKWLHRKKLPEVLVAHYRQCSFRGDNIVVDSADMACESDMIEYNSDEPYLFPSGFLQIGGALNGDPIVMDFQVNPFQIGYLAHDEVWSPNPPPAREHYVVVAKKLSEFLRAGAQTAVCQLITTKLAEGSNDIGHHASTRYRRASLFRSLRTRPSRHYDYRQDG